MDFYKVPSRPY